MTGPRWEIAFVLLTGVGHLLLAGWLQLQLAFVVGASLFWTGFVLVRAATDREVLVEWGFTTRNLGRSLRSVMPFTLLAVSGFAAYGALSGSMVLHWHVVWICLLYPLWGLVQQFLVVALVAGNVRRLTRIPERGIVILTALVFAGVHVPSLPLVAAAFCLATITTTVYLRRRNLWALGLCHGWYATGLYYLVLGQDLWEEVVSARLWP